MKQRKLCHDEVYNVLIILTDSEYEPDPIKRLKAGIKRVAELVNEDPKDWQ